MFVRVFDIESNIYFKSEVYAVINSGWNEKQLVIVLVSGNRYFKFFDYLDKTIPGSPKVLINSISPNGFHSEFECIHKRTDDVDKQLEEYLGLLDTDISFFEYSGYAWIYNDRKLLTRLLRGDMVSTKGFEHQMIDLNAYKIEGWNYVETQEDIDFILKETNGFHDSVLKDLSYISGSYVNEKNVMSCSDNERKITMRFDSQWCCRIELVFEGVVALNLRPFQDDYFSNINGATLLLKNASIFSIMTSWMLLMNVIKAHGLRRIV